ATRWTNWAAKAPVTVLCGVAAGVGFYIIAIFIMGFVLGTWPFAFSLWFPWIAMMEGILIAMTFLRRKELSIETTSGRIKKAVREHRAAKQLLAPKDASRRKIVD